MYHTIVYNSPTAPALGTNVDLFAATDTEVSVRNNHYIFTERYRMLGAAAVGLSVTGGRFQVP